MTLTDSHLAEGRRIAEHVLASFPSCLIPGIAHLSRTLSQWRAAFLAYWATDRSSNGGTEAVNGLIELARGVARGFRNYNNHRLRMLLSTGGLDPTAPPEVRRTPTPPFAMSHIKAMN